MITEILYNLNPVMFDAIIDANNDNALLKVKESIDNSEFVAILADRFQIFFRCNCSLFL
jgi:predicted LPLAT superfamily acyltransferase